MRKAFNILLLLIIIVIYQSIAFVIVKYTLPIIEMFPPFVFIGGNYTKIAFHSLYGVLALILALNSYPINLEKEKQKKKLGGIKMVKIALTGKVRSGKDTVAEYLDNEYGLVPFAFGGALKSEFHKEYPHIPRDPKPVRGYQLYGQLMKYVKDSNIWIDKCFERIVYTEEVARNYDTTGEAIQFSPMITDLRQPDEYERCLKEGFTIVRVSCPDDIRLERLNSEGDKFTLEDLNFETEKWLDSFDVDYDITNDSTLDNLYKQLDNVMAELGVEPK